VFLTLKGQCRAPVRVPVRVFVRFCVCAYKLKHTDPAGLFMASAGSFLKIVSLSILLKGLFFLFRRVTPPGTTLKVEYLDQFEFEYILGCE
jgi:hypothetical protein